MRGAAPAWRGKFAANLLIAGIALLIERFINPFGVEQLIDDPAATVMQQVLAPSYGCRPAWVWPFLRCDDTAGQKLVTVVLIDPAYMDRVRDGRSAWPLPVAEVTRLVQHVLDAKPKALFVDIAFPDAPREIFDGGRNSRTEADTALAEGLAGLHGAPVFFANGVDFAELTRAKSCDPAFVATADIPRVDAWSDDILRRMMSKAAAAGTSRPPELVYAAYLGEPTSYPLLPLMTGPPAACGPLAARREGAFKELLHLEYGSGFLASPAVAMLTAFAADCRAELPECREARLLAGTVTAGKLTDEGHRIRLLKPETGRFSQSPRLALPLSPRWGDRMSEQATSYYRQARNKALCEEQFRPAAVQRTLASYVSEAFRPLRVMLGDPASPSCTYIDTISAGALVEAQLDAADPASTQLGGRFIRDRLVLLGVALPQSQDIFASPVNGNLPGVYLHAVALENLITSGRDFRTASHDWGTRLALLAVLIVISAAMPLTWDALVTRLTRQRGRFGTFVLAPLAYLVCGAVVALTLIAVLDGWLRLPLAELAAPVAAIHVFMFGEWLALIKRQLEIWLGVPDRPELIRRGRPQSSP